MKVILVLFLSVTKIIHCGKFEAPMKLKNLICEYNETLVKGEYCLVKSHSRVKRTAEIKAHILKPFRNGTLIFNVFKRYSDWKPWVIYNVRINACAFLAGKSNPYVNIIKHIIKKYTTFNHTCPYLPGPLIISDIDLRDVALGTLIIPSGEYRLDVILNANAKTNIFVLKFIAEVWERF